MRGSIRCGLLVLLVAVACGKGSGSDQKIPPKPANGSPIAAEFAGFFDAKGGERGVKVHLYNYGDKTAAGYVLLARYYDDKDTLLKVKPGTPFEKDTAFTSLSGRRYMCKPKAHATLEVDMLNVPPEAKRAEILVSKVDAVGADGMKVEDWWSQDQWSEWPEAAGGAPAPQ